MKEYPDWANGAHVTLIGRPRVVCGMRFLADEGRDRAQAFTPLPLETFRDDKGHWCFGPEEEA